MIHLMNSENNSESSSSTIQHNTCEYIGNYVVLNTIQDLLITKCTVKPTAFLTITINYHVEGIEKERWATEQINREND